MPFHLFPHPPLATPFDIFAGALGTAAALLVVGGSVFLRAQSNRHRFALMQAALEKGITAFPNQPPYWLISMRQGITTITLGFALLVVGTGAWVLGNRVEMPAAALTEQAPPPPQPGPPPGPDHHPDMAPDGPDHGGPDHGGPDRGGPDGHRPPPPPPHNPLIDQWHRAQMEATLGQIAVGSGFILLLLGLARTSFARTERTYAQSTPPLAEPARESTP
jgi:hypothetical protein